MKFRALLLSSVFVGWVLPAWSAKQPNVIIILTDDAGYADFGFTEGDELVETPHIDRLAEQGIYCSQGYVTS